MGTGSVSSDTEDQVYLESKAEELYHSKLERKNPQLWQALFWYIGVILTLQFIKISLFLFTKSEVEFVYRIALH